MNLNGLDVIHRNEGAVYLRIPKELQKSVGICNCPDCNGKEAFWDTLGVPLKPTKGKPDTAWTLHMPKPPKR
jgi:hypothetical protein